MSGFDVILSYPASSIDGLSESIDDRVAALLVAGSNVTLTYDDGLGTLTIDASGGSGGGDVSKVGTPVNNQVGVWTGNGTIEGDSALTFDTSTDTLTTGTVVANLTGNVTGNVSGSSGSCTGNSATATSAGNASTVTTNANLTGDVTSVGNATTLATVNSNVGSFTAANITVNAKGLVTAAANGSGGGSSLTVNAQTITTTDVTGAVNQLYVCTIAGLTAVRNLTLPSGSVGDRIGVYIVDGDDTYALVIKGAASQTINGGSAATEWSRLFIANEYVEFYCIAANTWIVSVDKRIPCSFRVHKSSAITTNTAATAKLIAFDTEDYDIGDCFDHVTNKYATIRRANKYSQKILGATNANVSDQKYYSVYVYDNVIASFTKSFCGEQRRNSVATSSNSMIIFSSSEDILTIGTLLVPVFIAEDTDMGFDDNWSSTFKVQTYFSLREMF